MQNNNLPIFYHEDFYRQIELVPEENYFASTRFIHDLPPKDGSIYGIKSMTTRPEQKIKLVDRMISFEELSKILLPGYSAINSTARSFIRFNINSIKD